MAAPSTKASPTPNSEPASSGQSGTILAKLMLVDNMTVRQVAASRGLKGGNWENFFGKRLEEVLETLAQVFGLVTTG
jgi:hypothetical protein